MRYRYNCGNEVLRVFIFNDLRVIVNDNKTNKMYKRTIREDESGKFFTWNKNKIYLNNWIRISMKELKEKIKNKERVIRDDLCQAILTDGVENARFIVPLNTVCGGEFFLNGSKFKDTLCKIEERCNRKVEQNYKITLVPVEPDNTVASCRDYYISDMLSHIEDGLIKIVIE